MTRDPNLIRRDDAPERIGIISDGMGCWALAHRDEADHAVHYTRDDLATPAPVTAGAAGLETFQGRVQPWMQACFGPEISADRLERGDRLLEEVFELLQSGGYPRERVASLTGYVWSRPTGEPAQEVGGVMVTLAAYCLAHELDMHSAGETELARIWTKVEAIRAKQAAKPKGSALPQEWSTPAPVVPAEGLAAELSLTMSRYDAAAPPDDENGMAAPVMLGPDYVRKIIAALRAGSGPSWEVSPLAWESFGLEMWADSVGGRYYISGHGGKWSWTFDDDDPYHHGETVASEEAAKSAANSHNTAHIATALRSAPPVGVWPDFIATPKYENPCEDWEDPRLPDFRLIWETARPLGYAIGLHGSMKRDCDLIAAPWVDNPAHPDDLIKALCVALNATQVGGVEAKPVGRIAVILQIDGYVKHIDLSIMPAPPVGARVWQPIETAPKDGVTEVLMYDPDLGMAVWPSSSSPWPNVTHWMPLPEPPAARAALEDGE